MIQRVQEFLVRIRRSDVSRLVKPQLPDCERGSATVEAVIGVPAFLLLLGLLIVGGRVAIAHQVVQSAASDAARAASIARTQTAAGRMPPPPPAEPGKPATRLPHHDRHPRHHGFTTTVGRLPRSEPPSPATST